MKFIKKYSPFVLAIVISGCGGSAGSLAWTYGAEDDEIKFYYDSLSLNEICSYWDWAWESQRKRGLVKQSLKRRGVNPMYCYNPELDALNQLQKDVNELKSRPVYKPVNPLIEKMKQGKVY